MSKLHLDNEHVLRCRESAKRIVRSVMEFTQSRSTVSIERTLLRLLGVVGADATEVPHVNRLVQQLAQKGWLSQGVAIHVGNVAVINRLPLADALQLLVSGQVQFAPIADEAAAKEFVSEACSTRWLYIQGGLRERDARRISLGESEGTRAYVLTATGNIYEDVRHAQAVAQHGGDIVAVIRSTAQSLLDYVPFGPTTEGYGGTFATQENFQIMRGALDTWSEENGRYLY